MPVKRKHLEAATTDYEKTWVLKIAKRGKYVTLASDTITAKAGLADESVQDVSFTTSIPTQTGDDLAIVKVTGASTDFTAARENNDWNLDVYIAESGGNAQPIVERYRFHQYPKETEA